MSRRKARSPMAPRGETPKPGIGAAKDRIPISTLAPDPKNARKMSDAARSGLAVSMKTFGPLDIVFNLRTGELVSGHQRVAELKAAGAAEVVMESKEWGAIEHPATGERFWVRFVDWDEVKQRMGNIVANNTHLQGEFTADVAEQLRELEDVDGFAELQLDEMEKGLTSEQTPTAHEARALADFDVTPSPKKAWILIATSSDRIAEIEAAVRRFEDADTRVEVSRVSV